MSRMRKRLAEVGANVDESMGVRNVETRPTLSPVASAKDIGRTSSRKFGRLELARIQRDETQPRKRFDEAELQRLADSIRDDGQIQPIGVRWSPDDQMWIVLTGERRWRAAQIAGLKMIDCYFEAEDLTSAERLKKQMIENLLRQDLAPLEEARGYAELMALNSWNGKQVSEALNVHPSRVSRGLNLLSLPADVQAKIESGEIKRSLAYELIKLDNADVQRAMAAETSEQNSTQRKAAKAVRQRRGKSPRKSPGKTLKFYAENGIVVAVSVQIESNYHEVRVALEQALEEVQLRIENRGLI